VGDSTKPEDVERVFAGRQAAMAFTDPPYNVSLGDHGGQQRGSRKRRIANDVRLVELDGLPATGAGDSEAMPRRTTELVADKLDEGRRALGIASDWVRTKVVMTPAPVPGTRSPIDSRLAVRRSSGL
jgi:hypothetical protein